ncbi:branched-chain amino acid ABC transporter permease [Pseudorhodoplanes sp.]|uniref:branched-chain amino acid ABC transporter permease n=1 Tax=Pseudorhodoplanes sp. TaxID=1934341 RepID=UPI003D1461E1
MTPNDAQRTEQIGRAFARHRWSWIDLIPLICAVIVYLTMKDYLPLATQVLITIVFALSLDLALGYGGIASLGHVAFFGVGAYAAGLYALHVSPEPISGLTVGAVAGTVAGAVTGRLILRTEGLTVIMLTLAIATLLRELAVTWRSVTGGADGLFGYKMSPIFGLFPFDLAGHTAYWYAVGVTAFVYFICKMIVNSPFGLTVRGIRENPIRMRAVGVSVTNRLVGLYMLSGALAAIAGALSAQVARVVGPDSLNFALSGNLLVMLILGGTGNLYGAFLGAAVFVVLSDRAAAVSPFHWLFAVGIVLILAVRYAPRGLVGLIETAWARCKSGLQT